MVDRVVNDAHEKYAQDGYNVGCVQFRLIKSNQYRDPSTLNWAWPLDSNISEYPLENEIVHIISSLNRFYYTRKVNAAIRVTSQPLFGLNEELSPIETDAKRNAQLQNSVANPRVDSPTQAGRLGRVFKEPTPRVYRLRHDEGDVVYEGRSGHSIRFGAAWTRTSQFRSSVKDQSPNILIRVGQSPTVVPSVANEFGIVTEDINNDQSSIYMVTDQIVPIELATKPYAIHGASVPDYPSIFGGNQIVVNTDRLIFNAKKDRFFLSAFAGIHATAIGNITLDTDSDHISWTTRDRNDRVGGSWRTTINGDDNKTAGRDIIQIAGRNQFIHSKNLLSLTSGIINLGSATDIDEPIVLGMQLRDMLEKLIKLFTDPKVPLILITSPPGQPSKMNPALVLQLTKLMTEYLKTPTNKSSKILSLDNFVNRSNQESAGVRSLEIG